MLRIVEIGGVLTVRLTGFVAMIVLTACAQPPSRAIQSCVTESGQSHFLFDLDTATGRGVLRYQFVGQDVFYSSEDVRADGAKLIGTARFLKGLTGETRGSSFKFEYDSRGDTFTDGAARYRCERLQDWGLVAVPSPNATDEALPQ